MRDADTTVFSFYWLNTNVNYDGDIYLTIIFNAGIHMMMYTYYFLSIHTRDIWWKRYLTSAQIVQFVCMLVQSSYMLWGGKACSNVSRQVTITYLVYIMTMFSLFMNFYLQSYTKGDAKGAARRGKTAKQQ